MRCPDCGKFVPFGDMLTDEIEVAADEESGEVSITGRLVLPCEQCGTELKALDVDETIQPAEAMPDAPEGWTVEFALESDPDIDPEDRLQTTDRRGKPIKRVRYMKTFRGVRVSGTVVRTASPPGGEQAEPLTETAPFETLIEAPASAFEECC